MTNKLFYGDNLDVLRDHVANESVDLVYWHIHLAEQSGSLGIIIPGAPEVLALEDFSFSM